MGSQDGIEIDFCDVSCHEYSDKKVDSYQGIITTEDIERIKRFHNISDKKMAFVSRLMSRYHIASRHSYAPKDIILSRKESGGKPIWQSPSPKSSSFLHFNISHDKEIVVLSSSPYPIGIDIMASALKNGRSKSDFFNSMRNILSFKEWEYVYHADGERTEANQIERFMQIWTIKESFVKCIGTGLYTEPTRINTKRISMHTCMNYMEGSLLTLDIKELPKSQPAVQNPFSSLHWSSHGAISIWEISLDDQIQPVKTLCFTLQKNEVTPLRVIAISICDISLTHSVYKSNVPPVEHPPRALDTNDVHALFPLRINFLSEDSFPLISS